MKRIRIFRGLTQRELGLELGYEERNAFHLLQLVRNPSKCNASDDKIRLSAIMTTMHGPLPAAMLMRKGMAKKIIAIHIRFNPLAINDRLAKFAKTKNSKKICLPPKTHFQAKKPFSKKQHR